MLLTEKDFHEFIESFIEILEKKDAYTRGHSNRVAHYAMEIAKKMNLSREEIELAHITGHLHDIGKIGIPDSILSKNGNLNNFEFDLIKKHSEFGYNILNKVSVLKEHALIVKYHHERWDGMGYPSGLKGKDIPLISRIISVADSFDAMTSSRSYRKALDDSFAIKELEKNSWKQFDGEIVEVFLREVLPQFITPKINNYTLAY